MAVTPTDVMAGKVLVQLGMAKARDVRSALRALDTKGGLDLISRFAQHGELDAANAQTARARVTLYERVWAEATYLRGVEKLTAMSPAAVARLLAETEAGTLRIGAWLVREGTLSDEQDAGLRRKQQRRLKKEGSKIVERYREDDFKGVARPLVHGSDDLDPASFTIVRLFRNAEIRKLVERERAGVAQRAAARKQAESEANAPSLRELLDAARGGLEPQLARRVFASLLHALDGAGPHGGVAAAAVRVLPDQRVELRAASDPSSSDAPAAWRTLRALAEGIDGATYTSPEAIRGGDVDGRSDVYSLGILLFEMLTGELPLSTTPNHAGSNREVVGQHLIVPPATLSEASPDRSWPEELEGLLARMLNKAQGERPTSASLIAELEAVGPAFACIGALEDS